MNNRIPTTDAKNFLIQKINENKHWYGSVTFRAILFKEKDELYLYLAHAILQHSSFETKKEFVNDYGDVIMMNLEFKLDELLDMIKLLPTEKLDIRQFKDVIVKGGFTNDVQQISSRHRYGGIYHDWPFLFVNYVASQNVHFVKIYDELAGVGKPVYPNFFDATKSFFRLEDGVNRNEPLGIQFFIPDYRARIQTLELAENQITITIDEKETTPENLIAQFYCTKDEKNTDYNSPDVIFDSLHTRTITIPFVPNYVHAYLIDKNSNQVIDSKAFGKWYTDRNDGVIVKTSKESVEKMLTEGENQKIEFKQDIDKEKHEFLESIVAFANTNDGIILLGVDNEGRVVGYHDDFDKIDKKIRGLVKGNCEPDVDITVEKVQVDGRVIIVTNVKEGSNKPYLLIGKSAYKRIKKDDYVMTRLDLDNLYRSKFQPSDPFSRSGL
ncbi:helix-turn-helix domain-containing protein [Candidatus Nitrosotenuis cloacae]|uniref:AlbA family DNA-binding domain-containing protein n=1 Tax=Candidatus Nitrosotenuis cloacae TaxID=1603555 RepID=UPI002281659C|nr:ATP-binding protein [Candidatus Nitrosotenuis cloacae]